jgi:hypothetical protein
VWRRREMYAGFFVATVERKHHLEDVRGRWIFIVWDGKTWIGLIWIRIGRGDGLL